MPRKAVPSTRNDERNPSKVSNAKSCFSRRKRPFRQAIKPYLLLLPMVVFSLGFVYYPFFKTFLYSFSRVNFKGEITGFVGLDNFRMLFGRRDFSIALTNTLKLACINTPVTMALTLLFAALCSKRRRLSGLNETLFSLPMAVSMASAAMIFRVLLNPTVGYVNYALGLSLGWYTDRKTAMAGILLLTIWMGLGFDFLLFLSAFRGISRDQLDAARMDGAGPIALFFRIQLPLISPTVFYAVCANLVLAMMTSGPVIILTDGGPARATTTLIFMMYSSGYGSSNYSLAACVSIVSFLLTFAFTLGSFALEGRRVHYQ